MEERIINYDAIREEHQNNILMQKKATHSWKLAFFLTFLLLMVSILFNWNLTTKSQLIPYVIEVDSKSGYATKFSLANKINYSVNESNKEYYLKEIIRNMRIIPRDAVLLSKNHKKNLYFFNNISINKYKELLSKEGIKEMLKDNSARDISITSINKTAGSENNYQIRWNETTWSKNGEELIENSLIGTFSLVIKEPKSVEELENNPLGIIVQDFSISKEKK